MVQVGVDGPGGLPAVCGGVNDGLRPIGDIASREDTGSSSCQTFPIDQQATPRSNFDACAFGQEGWIGSFTNGNQDVIDGEGKVAAKNGHGFATALFIRFT